MNGSGRAPALAGAVVALGLLGGPVRAEFLGLSGTTAAVNTKGDAPDSVAGSEVTLSAVYGPAGAIGGSGVTYTWTVDFVGAGSAPTAAGAAGYTVMTRVVGDGPLGVAPPAPGGFAGPILSFFALGNTAIFQLAGAITPEGAVAPGGLDVGVEVNTATGFVGTQPVPQGGPGPVILTGSVVPVPEPATIALLGAGGLMLLAPRLRRRSRRRG